jgi:hypothetical protein
MTAKEADHELFMYATYKMQGPTQPTFTIGFANNSSAPVEFGPENVKAFFRGAPVPVYTYPERIEEIQVEKRGKQIALAILGGIAAGAAAYSASHQTYRSNYNGAVYNRGRVTNFSGTSTLRVYDPMSGIIAGAAVGGATGLGIRQMEFNAASQEQAANSILQANTVDAQRMVTGDLVLRSCCDQFPSPQDLIRFEITVGARVHVFEFARVKPGEASTPSKEASLQTGAQPAVVLPVAASVEPKPVEALKPPVAKAEASGSSGPVPTAAAPAPLLAIPLTGGQDGYNAERLARAERCNEQPVAKLSAKGPGFETYTVVCANGDAVAIRCEFGQCRTLK